MIQFTSYRWQSGDVLLVKSARFELVSGDKLMISFSTQLRTNPQDPDIGDLFDFKSAEGRGAERIK